MNEDETMAGPSAAEIQRAVSWARANGTGTDDGSDVEVPPATHDEPTVISGLTPVPAVQPAPVTPAPVVPVVEHAPGARTEPQTARAQRRTRTAPKRTRTATPSGAPAASLIDGAEPPSSSTAFWADDTIAAPAAAVPDRLPTGRRQRYPLWMVALGVLVVVVVVTVVIAVVLNGGSLSNGEGVLHGGGTT